MGTLMAVFYWRMGSILTFGALLLWQADNGKWGWVCVNAVLIVWFFARAYQDMARTEKEWQ